MTYVEAKFGFKIRDSKPSDTGLREHSEVGAVNSLLSVEGRESSGFNETVMQARTQARNCLAKLIKASHGPRVSPQSQAEDKVSPKEPRARSKFPEAQAMVKQ